MQPLNRLKMWAGERFFSAMLAFLFANQKAAYSKPVRGLVMFFFGRFIASRYHQVIAMYGDLYGRSLEAGLTQVSALLDRAPQLIVDCGAGTGFVSEALASRFPEAHIIALVAVPAMLLQAKHRLSDNGTRYSLVRCDTAAAPLQDGCADLVVAQNTTPFVAEFGRLCRPEGVVLFTDSSAKAVVAKATAAFRATGQFDTVDGRATESGFYVAARRRQGVVPAAPSGSQSVDLSTT